MPIDLSSLIFASSAVSLLTLGALLLRRRLPETLRIPSWFFGAREDSAERKIRFALPPWLAWLCVLLFTLGACLLFWPTPPAVSEGRTRQSALVWVDPTLSAHLSRAQNGFDARAIALRLREGGQRLHGLGTRPASDHPLSFRYAIVPLEDQASVEKFLREESNLLVPYARPFAEQALLDALRENVASQGDGGFFFAVSDGQAETLQSVSFLSRSFSAGKLFSTGAPRSFTGDKTEIIPASLARAWNVPTAGTPFQPLGATDGTITGGLIPPQARPGIAIERFGAEEGQGSSLRRAGGSGEAGSEASLSLVVGWSGEAGSEASLSLVVGWSATDNARSRTASGGLGSTGSTDSGGATGTVSSDAESAQGVGRASALLKPLLTACGGGVGGPTELDPASDLRALAGFLDLPFRREACLEHTIESTEQATGNPWAWRQGSLWVVPLTEEVAGTLGGKSEFWFPRGFEPCCDTLVYTAPMRQADAPNLELVRGAVQLDAESAPVTLALAPRAPEGALRYPRESLLAGTLPRGAQPDEAALAALPESDTFAPFLEAADGTVLASKARRARVAYVRTGLSMPNGELGRSSVWSQLWLSLLDDTGQSGGPRLTLVEPASPAEILRLPPGLFAAQLSPETLAFGAPLPYARAGLFRSSAEREDTTGDAQDIERGAPLTLVSVSSLERVQSVLSEQDFASFWAPGSDVPVASGDSSARDPRPARHVLAGAALALTALAGLWLLPIFLRGKRSRLLFLFPLFFTFGLSPYAAHEAHAQAGLPPQSALRRFFFGKQNASELPEGAAPNIPFRIGWCDTTVPADVAARYTAARDLLASRGTIELPKQLVAGGCRPGAAEIWWGSDVSSFDVRTLADHVTLGGAFVVEGQSGDKLPESIASLDTPGIGLRWEKGQRRGLLYRSFYLLPSFDNCPQESTWLLSLRKRVGSNTPTGLVTRTRFLSAGGDCFGEGGAGEMRERSFVNLIYAFLTTDYKEDQLQLPEILSRVRNLGLEP